MSIQENPSEVARFRQQQALQEQAAQQGLSGVAAVASHAAIMTRMRPAAEHIARLLDEGKHEEALVLMNRPMWGAEEVQAVTEQGVTQV